MNGKISFELKTLSNLFIGGAPAPFEIGGIDQFTVTDPFGFPCIPASSMKGTLAAMIREDNSDKAKEITELYRNYLRTMENVHQKQIDKLAKDEALERIKKRFREALAPANMAEYLFGISGFNNTPKLIFGDLILKKEYRDPDNWFSIDMKNCIDASGQKPQSNPRSYKTAKSGLVFDGAIRLHKISDLGEGAEALCITLIKENLLKFNEGIYRLGNSKSRGYGKVEVDFSENQGE